MLSQLATFFSFQKADKPTQNLLSQSASLNCLGALGRLLCFNYTNLSLGKFLQKLSFCFTLILFACLALPQFANDKEGLAFIALAGVFFWLLGTAFGGPEKRTITAVDLLVLSFGAINLVAAFSSHYLAESLKGLAKVFVYLASYFVFTAQLEQNSRRKPLLIFVLIFSGTLIALYGLYQYKIGVPPLATWEDPNIENPATRIYATLGNPNLLAGYLVPLAPLAAAFTLATASRRQWLMSLWSIISTLIIVVAIVLTGSRGGYLGLAASFLAFGGMFGILAWQRRPQLRPLIAGLIILAPIVIFLGAHFIPSIGHRIDSIFVGREHSSNSFRLNVWTSSLAMLKDNWWIGIGVGNKAFRLAYGLYMLSGFDALGTYCVPLEVAVETGVIGLGLYILIVVSALSRGHLQFALNSSAWQKYLKAGVAAALIGLTFHGLVDTVFYRPQVHFFFWLLIALLITPDEPSPKPNYES